MTTKFFENQMLPHRGVIAISGDGALAFLHNLLTCDVATLAQGQAAYGALLSPQGKILHDIFVFNAGEQVLIDCASEQRDALLQKLMMYKLRAKLTIAARDDLEVAVGDEGYVDPRNPEMGHRFFAAKGAFKSGGGYDAARIALGLADSVQDIGTNNLFPHEANLDQFGGVNFTKGCYVGQEVVSRMQHRGTARSRILPVTGQGLTKGASITSADKSIGEILSTTRTNALALIRLDRLGEATAPLLSNAVTLKVQKPDWIKYDITIPEAAR
jgi:tRNA-modifying protein YgfZ